MLLDPLFMSSSYFYYFYLGANPSGITSRASYALLIILPHHTFPGTHHGLLAILRQHVSRDAKNMDRLVFANPYLDDLSTGKKDFAEHPVESADSSCLQRKHG
jgi:hypothetical protein